MVFLLVVPSVGWACGCPAVEGESFEASVARDQKAAVRVFVGRVVRWDDQTVTFAIDTIWKGDDAAEVVVNHGEFLEDGLVSINTCVYRFRRGGRYLVFAHAEGRTLKASTCGHTRLLEEAARVVGVLDAAARRRSPQNAR
jgi:hypothetical protein